MGGSRRKFKRTRTKVRVGLPRKKPREFKPAFDLPEALAAAAAAEAGGHVPSWDAEGSVVKNYSAFGVVANPNLLGAPSRGTRGSVSHPFASTWTGSRAGEFMFYVQFLRDMSLIWLY